MAAPDIHLESRDLRIFHNRRDSDVIGTELHAIIRNIRLVFLIEVNCRKADLEFSVQEVRAVFDSLLRIPSIVRVYRENFHECCGGKPEIFTGLLRPGISIIDF